ncbi:hypothetical protein EU293_21605 [Salmonella enterica subsp. enterica serovar Eastbourne]|nr:hypothetical protein [Salmonella enterica subsp. enterica serovar Eastbourne]
MLISNRGSVIVIMSRIKGINCIISLIQFFLDRITIYGFRYLILIILNLSRIFLLSTILQIMLSVSMLNRLVILIKILK